MPTLFDNIFVPLAKQLIDATFGFSAVYRAETKTFSAATGKNSVSAVDTAVKITPPAPYDQRRIDGTIVVEGDQWIMMSSASGVVPKGNDKMVIGGSIWMIVRIKPIVSGEQTAAYEVQLRQ